MSRTEIKYYTSRSPRSCGIHKRMDPVIYRHDTAEAPLSEVQLAHYEKNGYLVIEKVFTETEINCLLKKSEELRKNLAKNTMPEIFFEKESRDVRSVFNIHVLDTIFGDLIRNKRLHDIAKYILDDDVYIHQSRLNFKPAFRGKEFYWHSDFETWHMEDGMPRMRALSMSITLTPNLEQNGPLLLMPGSHKTYISCAGETPEDHYRQSLVQQQFGVPDDVALKLLSGDKPIVSAVAPIGSVILFDCNMMHGSNGNITPFPRTNVFFVYNALCNRLQSPYCGLAPRPEFVAARNNITAI